MLINCLKVACQAEGNEPTDTLQLELMQNNFHSQSKRTTNNISYCVLAAGQHTMQTLRLE